MSLKVQVVPVTPYQQNCSIIQCQATGLAAIVDPGGDIDRIEGAITKMDATVEKILLTHGHLDHCAAADVLRQKLTVPMEGPEQGDSFWIDKLPEWCEMAGFPRAEPFTPDRWLEDGDTITVDAEQCTVTLAVSDDEMAQRRAQWSPPEPYAKRGTLAKYAQQVSSASEGAVTDKYLD